MEVGHGIVEVAVDDLNEHVVRLYVSIWNDIV